MKVFESKFFPAGIIVLDSKTLELVFVETNNKKTSDFNNNEHHAEQLFLESNEYKKWKENNPNGKLILIITFPPCYHCFQKIINSIYECEIYFLFDPWRKIINKKYIDEFQTKFKVSLIEFNDENIDLMWKKVFEKYNTSNHKKSLEAILEIQQSKQLQRN